MTASRPARRVRSAPSVPCSARLRYRLAMAIGTCTAEASEVKKVKLKPWWQLAATAAPTNLPRSGEAQFVVVGDRRRRRAGQTGRRR